MGLRRVRAAIVGLIGVVTALMAGRIFDDWILSLAIPAALVTLTSVVVLPMRWYVRLLALPIALVAGLVLVVVVEGGSLPADAVDAVVRGPRRLLSTEWPSPRRPDLLGAAAVVAGACTAVGVSLCASRRWHLLPLAPMIVLYVLVVAASAPAGPATWWLLPLGVLGALVAALAPTGDLSETVRILAGERRAGALTAVAIGLAAAVSVPLAFDDRADPRSDEIASAAEPVVEPIEAVVALRDRDQPLDVYELRSDDELPFRWRTGALDQYDGQRWSPTARLVPIGRRLGPDRADEIDVEVETLTTTDAVPLPGPPVTVDAGVQTDEQRTIVRLLEPAAPGDVIEVSAGTDPARAAVADGQIGTRPVDELASTLTSTATTLAGAGTITEQLANIEAALRDEYELDPQAPASGLQLALVERFLTDTRRGTEEQFVTGFVLLARSLGVDARVAIGFDAGRAPDSAAPEAGAVTLSSQHAEVWPEVRVDDVGWVAMDPVPEQAVPDDSDPVSPAREVAPAAPQPPLAPPADDPEPDDQDEAEADAATDEGLPTLLVWAAAAGLAVATVLAPILLVVAVILLLKAIRRRRRLRVDDPRDRVRGAWAEATDALVDAGLRIPRSWTDDEIAHAGAAVAGAPETELARLGSMSSAATYASAPVPADDATDAVARLEQVESGLSSARTRWQRLRWRLSLRSLRRSTRSPVLGPRHRE